MSDMSGAFPTALENPRETWGLACGTVFSALVVLITASGLQGEQPLVDRTM